MFTLACVPGHSWGERVEGNIGSVYTDLVPWHSPRVRYSLQLAMGTNESTPFFQVTRPCTRAQNWTKGLYVYTAILLLGQSNALHSLLSSCFKMASDKARWSNYVNSRTKYGFQGVKTTPFSAGTQAVDPQHQVWTAPMSGKYVEGLSSIVTAIQTGWLIRAKLSYTSHFPLG